MRMQAMNNTIHGRFSNGIISVPLKYSTKQMGQHNAMLMKPNIENVNATCATGGSPIIFRNIT